MLSGWLENYAELLQELGIGTPADPTPDDVDLLLALCRRDGPAALGRVRGPLAAIVWEPQLARLTAIRDHLGESAVCFAGGPGLLMLASEEAALLRHPAVSAEPDLGWLGRFAARMPLPPGRTAFRDIAELSPGEQCQWHHQSLRRWRVPAVLPSGLDREPDRRVCATRWREAFAAGIPPATRRGRQFGLMLSGGMDSTTVAAFGVPAIRASGRDVAAYCWRLDHFAEGDESPAIRDVASRVNVRVNWFSGDDLYPVLDPDSWPACPNLPQLNPFLGLNLAAYEAARSAGCDVVLNGHLGDYLYPHRHHGLADALRVGNWHQGSREWRELIRRFGPAGCWTSPDIRWFIKLFLKVRPRQIPPPYLAAPALRHFEKIEPWPPETEQAPHPAQWSNLFGTTSAMEMKYERYFASRAGIERRHPLRHQRILETVLALPGFLFFDPKRDKALTRDAMQGLLPDHVVHGVPGGNLSELFLHGVFRAGLPATRALLTHRGALWPEIVSRDYVNAALQAGPAAGAEQQRVLIAAAGMELWRHAIGRR